jgi:hypothetical protein
MKPPLRSAAVSAAALLVFAAALPAQQATGDAAACDFSGSPGVVWWGTDRTMTLQRFVSYLAPVFWHSPDEPLMHGLSGDALTVPEPMPFQRAEGPVVYYQLKELVTATGGQASQVATGGRGGRVFSRDSADIGRSIVDLGNVVLARLDFYAYYSDEVGVGAHKHDLEAAEFKVLVLRSDDPFVLERTSARCPERNYLVLVSRVSAKAHGLEWFWNIAQVDEETKFPMYLLVEEGKHALATDRNSDGYFTPGYDVTVRVNDAWGVRDIIRSGGLFSGGYEAWMTKVRRPEHRVMPPLPPDSPLRPEGLERQEEYSGGNATYELRPLPTGAEIRAYDAEHAGGHHLYPFVKDKEVPGWPVVSQAGGFSQLEGWVESGIAKKSLSIAAYADGGKNLGVSWVFPFFVVKNLEIPMSGGYLLHRMYLTGDRMRDFGWMALYANSASRWFDTYFAAGAEWQKPLNEDGTRSHRTDFVLETGIKFRAQIGHSPLKFLSFFTDFWGVRAGIKNYGFFDIDRLTYVLELGAGSF